ncbi:lysine-specific demethylase 2A [Striga asiatica]|uniref:Lysine-specific demethylase 2A n=1 Tax=Striga asiatica TaxID=4170 RepID=A0A5A7NYG0_STRAF|nr:lysine-specific demethylase 2A [Striga asiatica]
MEKAKVREPLVPCVLLDMRVPMLATTTLPVLVDPSRPIVALPPSTVPTVPVFALPPCLPLLKPTPIRPKVFIPLVAPFGPTVPLETLGPFVRVLHTSTLPVKLLAPPIVNVLANA